MLAGGRFTIPAETRYSPTEGECLAVAVGLESSRYYTLGCKNLVIATDHKPLLSILNDRALDTIVNPRLLRIKERTLMWQFDIVYVSGWRQAAADSLSRRKSITSLSSLSVESLETEDMEDDLCQSLVGKLVALEQVTVSAVEGSTVGMVTWEQVKEATNKDAVLTRLIEIIQRGFPESSVELAPDMKPYFKFRHGLVVVDGVVCYKDRLVVPECYRDHILKTLHSAHQGVSGMLSRAKQTVFWPGITKDVIKVRAVRAEVRILVMSFLFCHAGGYGS